MNGQGLKKEIARQHLWSITANEGEKKKIQQKISAFKESLAELEKER